MAALAGICTASDYLNVVHTPPVEGVAGGTYRVSLEGFLFPDTYDIDDGLDADAVAVALQVKRFDDQVMPEWSARHPASLTLFQTVTLASLVERERNSQSSALTSPGSWCIGSRPGARRYSAMPRFNTLWAA